jgi:hypothetical protein
VLSAFPFIGLALAVAIGIYASRSGDRALRVIALVLIPFFLGIFVLRLVAPG